MRWLFIFLLFISSVQALTFKEKFAQAAVGDYIAAEANKTISLFYIRSLTPTTATLEEVTTTKAPKVWQEWLDEGAPGNTSWVAYTLDLERNKIKDCYSFSQKSWLTIEDSLFLRLLSLPLSKVQDSQRKRIGNAPNPGETDRRSVWNPPVIMNGKKIEKASIEAFSTKWPDDGSQLAHCDITLYFSSSQPFPSWIEIKSPHYAQNIRTIDSGSNIQSPHAFIPTRLR